MASQPDPTDERPETFGAPTEYADAAEAPQWIQTAAKAIAFVPAALSVVSIGMLVIVALALCLVVTAVLAF